MNQIKTILVVDDNQENLDAAKSLFDTITDFRFVYVTNRKDAENQFDNIDAVITDRMLPTNGNVEFLDCEVADKDLFLMDSLLEANGYHILYSAYFKNKPTVMISGHGNATALFLPNVKELTPNQAKYLPEDFSLEVLLEDINKNPSTLLYENLHTYGNYGGVKFLGWNSDLLKTSQKAWTMAWEELKKQF